MSDEPGPRTLRAEDWSVPHLLDAKAGRRVSVVVPARDEEKTVGGVVATVREAWVERTGLVDELVVIDSDSVDGTAVAARDAGASVHSASAVRPDLGRAEGKGEALWKSLLVTTGDVLVFLDADVTSRAAHYVPGLLGPLLTDPGTALVKSVYERPLLQAQSEAENESGGRVTELVARPLLALHRPALAGLVQPLSGEWAVRRDVVEALPLPVGYGVEIAVLIDTADRHGVRSVAQVDLGRRIHRHHHHHTLGAMALQVMAAVERRVLRPTDLERDVTLRQFERHGDTFRPVERRVPVWERPPVAEVSGYAVPPPSRPADSVGRGT
ncbi:MAG TPA: glucosyl-3-phosphoglycerate synthase [Dermatophilaceae bacterium]|nr:glucosyl-3-phosphoglycerate synthase [Dermatophilaceae bacterium]